MNQNINSSLPAGADAGMPVEQATDLAVSSSPAQAGRGFSNVAPGEIAAPEYFGPVKIAPEFGRGYSYLSDVFMGTGTRPEIANHGLAIVDRMMDGEVPEQPVAHKYDLSAYHFRPEDMPYVNFFANQMHAKGARQSEVNAFLNLYRDAEQAKAKRAELNARKQSNAGKSVEQRKEARSMSLEEIKQTMRTDRQRYFRDPAMQERYRQLIRKAG